jgi:hypothetical protein
MAVPGGNSLELRERAARTYRSSDPKPQIRRLVAEIGVHPGPCAEGPATPSGTTASVTTA